MKKVLSLLAAALLGATLYAAGGINAHQEAPHTQGLYAGGFIGGCWDEPNAQMPNGMERICGDLHLMPIGAVRQGVQEDDPVWDCHTMGDKHCGYDPKETK